MNWIEQILTFLWEAIKNEFAAMVAAVLFVQIIQRLWDFLRFGNWRVVLMKEGKEILDREISTGKAKEILDEDAELAVFLKGVISPYAWVTCDLLKKGREIGLLNEDNKSRIFMVDLDKNQPVGSNPTHHQPPNTN